MCISIYWTDSLCTETSMQVCKIHVQGCSIIVVTVKSSDGNMHQWGPFLVGSIISRATKSDEIIQRIEEEI